MAYRTASESTQLIHYGVDIGGTKIELTAYATSLSVLFSTRVSTPSTDYQEFLDTVAALVADADAHAKGSDNATIGIGLAAFVDENGIGHSANIACLNGKPLLSDLRCLLLRPVSIGNDAKLFILSEVRGGAANDAACALGVILGTGLSGAAYINARLHDGRQRVAGEYGHIPISAVVAERHSLELRQCGCGLLGCVERYLSGPGLLYLSAHFGANYQTVSELLQGVRAGDRPAINTWDCYIDCLGSFLAQLVLIVDPDVIVLAGGLSNIGEIYEQVPAAVQRHLFANVSTPDIKAAQFGDASGARGAALLGRQEACDSA